MKKRPFLIILLFILILLIILLLNIKTKKNDTEIIGNEKKFEANTGVVYNQGSDVLKYKDMFYIIDNSSNSIIRYNDKTKYATIISKYQGYTYNDNMYIINNNLLYSIENTTYYMGLDTLRPTKFTNGRVVYINDEIYIYLLKEDGYQNLYVTSYDNTTFKKTNEFFYRLGKGYEINYLNESDNLIFFSTVNSDKSTSLFSVDLEKKKVDLIIRESSFTSEFSRGEIVHAVKNDDKIYYVVARYAYTTESESVSEYLLYEKVIGQNIYEFIKNDIEPYLIKDKDSVIFGKFNLEENKYEWKTLFDEGSKYESWMSVIQSDFSRYLTLENSVISFNGKQLSKLEEKYSDYSISYAKYCDGYILILLEDPDYSHVWFSCKRDGTDLRKIYE